MKNFKFYKKEHEKICQNSRKNSKLKEKTQNSRQKLNFSAFLESCAVKKASKKKACFRYKLCDDTDLRLNRKAIIHRGFLFRCWWLFEPAVCSERDFDCKNLKREASPPIHRYTENPAQPTPYLWRALIGNIIFLW